MPPRPFTVRLDQAPAYWSLGELLTIVASAEQTGGAFSLIAGPGGRTLEQLRRWRGRQVAP
jgi:hypothetical protein